MPIRQQSIGSNLLRIADDLKSLRREWLEDHFAWNRAATQFDLPTLRTLAEKISLAPAPPELSPLDRAQAFDPVDRERAVKACIVATASLGGPKAREETEIYYRAIRDVTIAAGASEAELLLVRQWVITAPGTIGRPDDLPLFRFRPAPAEWDAMLRQARRQIRDVISVIDRRRDDVAASKRVLANWPDVEAQAERRRQSINDWAAQNEEKSRVAIEIGARRKQAQEEAVRQREIDRATEQRERRKRLATALAQHRARSAQLREQDQ